MELRCYGIVCHMDIQKIVDRISQVEPVDGIYFFGSRFSGTETANSDFDLGILFTRYIGNTLDAFMRPQLIKQALESELELYDCLDLMDLELAPLALQYAAIQGDPYQINNATRLHRFENKVLSMIEAEEFNG